MSVRREALHEITPEDVVREGFPTMTVPDFMRLYRNANGGEYGQPVTRIEFEYVEE